MTEEQNKNGINGTKNGQNGIDLNGNNNGNKKPMEQALLESKNSEIEKQIIDKKEDLEILLGEIRALNEKKNELIGELDNKKLDIRILEEDIAERINQYQNLKLNLEDINEEINLKNSKMGEINYTRKRLIHKIESLKATKEAYHKEILLQEAKIEDYEKKISEFEHIERTTI